VGALFFKQEEFESLLIKFNVQKQKIYIYAMHAYNMQKQTSIRISLELLNTLKKFKETEDSYEDVIWDFIEPHLELSEETKKDIELAKKEYEKGNFVTLEEVKKELGF